TAATLSLAGLAPQPELVAAVVGQKQRPRACVAPEQVGGPALLVGPGVGEDDVEVTGCQAEPLLATVFLRNQPGEARVGSQVGRAAGRDEGAVDEVRGQAEVVRELPGLVHQLAVDLDAAGVEVEHGGQARHDAEAAPPLAEQVAAGEVLRGQGTQDGVGPVEVAGHKAGNAAVVLKPLDASPGLAQEGANVPGHAA